MIEKGTKVIEIYVIEMCFSVSVVNNQSLKVRQPCFEFKDTYDKPVRLFVK